MSLFNELKRRNVFRVAIAYLVVVWLVMQISDVVLNNISAPDWVFQALMLFLAIGFPFAVIFAWAFELTPEGLKRENEVDRSQSITSKTGRRIDLMIIGVLVIAVGGLLVDKFISSESPEPTEVVVVDDSNSDTAAPSIAVLPFANMSADESSVYFSDGLADTVLHMLAQIRELRVAARTSSFQFRDQLMDVAEIGKQLNVGAILEGSVQRSGDKIRVTAQLIDVSSGYHLWSGNFDRDLNDVFVIQDEIAQEVVAALKVSLLGESAETLNRDQTGDVDAYTEYLLAINDLNSVSSENLLSAVSHLLEAIRIDPNYARAHSTLGRAYFAMRAWGAMGTDEATAAARDAASRALDIAADSSEALAVLGYAELLDRNMQMAEQLLNKATELNSNDVVALDYYARYLGMDARPVEAIATYQKILNIDPLSEEAHGGLAVALTFQQRYAEASEIITRFKSISSKSDYMSGIEFNLESAQGNWAAAITMMTDELARNPDEIDPEGPAIIGHAYLALDMPEEASRWFDRALEIDTQHPMSRAAPLFLNYYRQQNEDDNVRLARKLLDEQIDNRNGSRSIAIRVLIEHAANTGRHEIALDALDNLYPQLFDDPPHGLRTSTDATFLAGWALIQSGDIERGSHLVQAFLDLQDPFDEAYGMARLSIEGRLLLGDIDGALEKLASFAPHQDSSLFTRLLLEHSNVFDPIRDEPAFIALLDEYRENAAEQRQLLQAMNENPAED